MRYNKDKIYESNVIKTEYNDNGTIYYEYTEKVGGNFGDNSLYKYRKTYTYNNFSKIKNVLEEWYENSKWVNKEKTVYNYHVNGSIISDTVFSWNTETSNWGISPDVTTYTNNELGNIIEKKIQRGYGMLSREIYTYHSFPTTTKQESSLVVYSTQLESNYPNPFNPATIIHYQIADAGVVNLKVYDVLGKEIATLVNEKQNVGKYTINFDASHLPAGIYFYRLQSGEFVETKKMVLLK